MMFKFIIHKRPMYMYCTNPKCPGHLLGYNLKYNDGTSDNAYLQVSNTCECDIS
jgi:hypothetical protein